jgi:hypothetical protein
MFVIHSKLAREIELDPFMEINHKELPTILNWQQVPPNIYRNRTITHHMSGGFLELMTTVTEGVTELPSC